MLLRSRLCFLLKVKQQPNVPVSLSQQYSDFIQSDFIQSEYPVRLKATLINSFVSPTDQMCMCEVLFTDIS